MTRAMAMQCICGERAVVRRLCRRRYDKAYRTKAVTKGDGYKPTLRLFCRRGHIVAGDNAWVKPSTGQRYCLACKHIRQKSYRVQRHTFYAASSRRLRVQLF